MCIAHIMAGSAYPSVIFGVIVTGIDRYHIKKRGINRESYSPVSLTIAGVIPRAGRIFSVSSFVRKRIELVLTQG